MYRPTHPPSEVRNLRQALHVLVRLHGCADDGEPGDDGDAHAVAVVLVAHDPDEDGEVLQVGEGGSADAAEDCGKVPCVYNTACVGNCSTKAQRARQASHTCSRAPHAHLKDVEGVPHLIKDEHGDALHRDGHLVGAVPAGSAAGLEGRTLVCRSLNP